jgi:aryl-alcohol dehydrogenase-like predicted oxidoreductase
VEKVEEALKAIEYPGVETVQIIFNMFRQRPAELFFDEAQARNIGVIVRVPLASGLLTGKFSTDATFEENDHRNYNREGEAFDRGETFAGVDFETGVEAARAIDALTPAGVSMAQFALRWILMFEGVSCAIPGAKKPHQVRDNTAAADLAPIQPGTMQRIREIYENSVYDQVHHRW